MATYSSITGKDYKQFLLKIRHVFYFFFLYIYIYKMMENRANYPGPSKRQAIEQFMIDLKPILLSENENVDNIEDLVNSSIHDGVVSINNKNMDVEDMDEESFNGSYVGWRVFGKNQTEKAIRRTLTEQITPSQSAKSAKSPKKKKKKGTKKKKNKKGSKKNKRKKTVRRKSRKSRK